MDTPSPITHVSLCAGYAGIDLGLKRAIPTLRTVAFSEIEAFACANLVSKMEAGLLDAAPIWTNLKTFPWAEFRDRVDILSGGYPCQPFSAAGKRLGQDDPRHLWPSISAGIALMRPRICFFENVEGHITLGLRNVLHDLAGMGYRATWGIFSASEVGAPHQRKRVFILAISGGIGSAPGLPRPQQGHEGFAGVADYCEVEGSGMADSCNPRPSRARGQSQPQGAIIVFGDCLAEAWPARPGEQQHGWEPPRVVANTASERAGQRPELCGQEWRQGGALPRDVEQPGEAMGNPNSPRPQERQGQQRAGIQGTHPNGRTPANGTALAPLGRNPHGPAGRLDYAELCVTCDNRTDELRLLGNGVVPATAERAWRVLWGELNL